MSTLSTICQHIKSRCDAMEYKGKKRDAMCIEMVAGALAALAATNSPDYAQFERVAYFLIATRGYSEIVRLAGESTEREQAA